MSHRKRTIELTVSQQVKKHQPVIVPPRVLEHAGIQPGAWLGFVSRDGQITIRVENPIWHVVLKLQKAKAAKERRLRIKPRTSTTSSPRI
jgi:hypothetical protein